jgi:hypothetical protein
MSMHVLSEANTNPASSHAVNLDAELCRRLCIRCALQEFVRVIDSVRMRKEIA